MPSMQFATGFSRKCLVPNMPIIFQANQWHHDQFNKNSDKESRKLGGAACSSSKDFRRLLAMLRSRRYGWVILQCLWACVLQGLHRQGKGENVMPAMHNSVSRDRIVPENLKALLHVWKAKICRLWARQKSLLGLLSDCIQRGSPSDGGWSHRQWRYSQIKQVLRAEAVQNKRKRSQRSRNR